MTTPFFDAYWKYEKLMPGAEKAIIYRCAIDELDGVCHHPQFAHVREGDVVTCSVCGHDAHSLPVNMKYERERLLLDLLYCLGTHEG